MLSIIFFFLLHNPHCFFSRHSEWKGEGAWCKKEEEKLFSFNTQSEHDLSYLHRCAFNFPIYWSILAHTLVTVLQGITSRLRTFLYWFFLAFKNTENFHWCRFNTPFWLLYVVYLQSHTFIRNMHSIFHSFCNSIDILIFKHSIWNVLNLILFLSPLEICMSVASIGVFSFC